MTVVLVTGFEPFGGAARNPSGDAAKRLHGTELAGHRVHGVELPCTFAGAGRALHAAIDAVRPVLVLGLGLAASRSGFWPERVAINLIDARIPDNAGAQPVDVPVLVGGAPAHFTTLPVKAMAAALQVAGHAAGLSHSAGTFVCNQVFYLTMQALVRRPGVRGGFIHLGGDLDTADVVRGVEVALGFALVTVGDLRDTGGSIDCA